MGGLRVTYGGSRLLDDMLRRIGLTASVPAKRSLARRVWHLLPARLRQVVARRFADIVRRNADENFWSSFDWAATV